MSAIGRATKVAFVVGVGVCAARVQSGTAAAQPAGPAPVADAQLLYLRDCAVCHGATGAGTALGPSLAGVGRAAVDYYVTTGRMPLGMPTRFAPDPKRKVVRHRSPYSAAEQAALVDYATALTGGGPDVSGIDLAGGNLGTGGELFRLQCAACHSWAGEGGALLHLEAPELLHATPRQAAEAVRAGPGAMPAFGAAALSDAQLADVVVYVDNLKHSSDKGGSPLWHLGPVAEGAIAWVIGLGALVLFIRWIGERG